jgi:hypothetical protein
MKTPLMKPDRFWRKSRIAARIILKKERAPLRPRELRLASHLLDDAGVTNRLIDQAMSFLKARKNGYRLLDRAN